MTKLFANLQTRPRIVTAALFAVAFVALVSHPTLAQSLGADVWNVSNLRDQVRAATDESARLSAEDDTVLNRIAVKESIVRELIEGRATLTEATDRFAQLNAARPQALNAIRFAYPGTTDREKTARNVISFALGRTPAAARAALSERLEAEFQQAAAAR
ncbi:hypothetical protein GobsT_72270 [Gemmata obscuriglobus]|uniref:Uncharacterized protein n=1 Tax=Gemmata obscuriglobus TaxID=114 RepID=A0A2Z3HD81_9BACT|nr:hypothetical protein [Gemmata obscuriglobus]AWM41686.1 hypothetical protein C1280_34950 [Gemmata obscuriglobus]QEG32372.1 hypothetical protein GobsT_72270 [Gemmata obscuriglobus]VTS11728.1 unnamed protein product [Gemmata obscuriglobus UQM 2246]